MTAGDAHVHTEWSWDAPNGSMEQACARAVALGLPTIAFTDHADFVPWNVSDGLAAFLEDLGATVIDGVFQPVPFDIDGYLESVERCRARFADLEIQRGVELGRASLVPGRGGGPARRRPVRRHRRRSPFRGQRRR